MAEIIVPELKPLNPEDCWGETYNASEQFKLDPDYQWLRMLPVTDKTYMLMSIVLFDEITVPEYRQDLHKRAVQEAQGEGRIAEIAQELALEIEKQSEERLFEKFEPIVDYFSENKNSLMVPMFPRASENPNHIISAYVDGVYLNSISDSSAEGLGRLSVLVALRDRYGNVGLEPEAYGRSQKPFFREDMAYTLRD